MSNEPLPLADLADVRWTPSDPAIERGTVIQIRDFEGGSGLFTVDDVVKAPDGAVTLTLSGVSR
jgi:hypothetical protein